MKHRLRAHLTAVPAAWLLGTVAFAEHTHFLLREDSLCDPDGRLCIRGSLVHHDISNVLLLSGRIERTAEPGLVVVRLAGTTSAGRTTFAELRFRVDGRYSEIVDYKMIPDAPSQTRWEISSMDFEPGESPAE